MFQGEDKSKYPFKYWFAHWCAYQMTALDLGVGKNFSIPNIDMEGIFKLLNNNKVKGYNIKWIGLGCIKGEIGKEWEPQIKIPRNDS